VDWLKKREVKVRGTCGTCAWTSFDAQPAFGTCNKPARGEEGGKGRGRGAANKATQ